MARQLTLKNNQFAPSGTITLVKSITVKNKLYSKIWAPFWDIVIKNDELEKNEVEREKKENWIWHALFKDEVVYHIEGSKVSDFQVCEVPPVDDEEVWVPDAVRKSTRYKKIKAKEK